MEEALMWILMGIIVGWAVAGLTTFYERLNLLIPIILGVLGGSLGGLVGYNWIGLDLPIYGPFAFSLAGSLLLLGAVAAIWPSQQEE